ncbi:ATP-binding protein [Pyrococcus kukulkanii]|uniref:ATP-binding protein n=1 Tax=Pyrococcus kukulkanii TaxID=1609559 RepID=UPI0035687DC7
MFMFYDREKELALLRTFVESEPNTIFFIYGPINSGKTTLLMEFSRRLSEDFVPFYINLRWHAISSPSDFLNILFSIHRGKKDVVKAIVEDLPGIIHGIPVPKALLREVIGNHENAFSYIIETLKKIRKSGKIPILILDELQKVEDLKINGPLLYELFNLLVGLTKELHLAHVFTITSDSLFIEKVYSEAMLHGRAEFFLVDDFDEDTAREFLEELGFKGEEIELVIRHFGGKPSYLTLASLHKDNLEEWCRGELDTRENWIKFKLNDLKRENGIIYREVMRILKSFMDSEFIKIEDVSPGIRWLVKQNILFLDPKKGILRPQGRLELLAIRRIVG